MNFYEKHILITGASSGIGEATARYLAQLGAKLTLIARREDLLANLCEELNVKKNIHRYVVADLTEDTAIAKLVEKTDSLDGVVHGAGIVFPFPIKFIKRKHLDQVWNINTYAPILLTSVLMAKNKINDKAAFVFISSISTQHPYPGGSLYVSSKAALEAFSRNLALEYAHKHIRSNVVSPALVKTQILEATIQASDAGKLKEYEESYPFGFGETADVAQAIAFFLSDESRWVTGQNLLMDGGSTLNTK